MENKIDIAFDVYSDTPKGRDPDSHSKTLRRYHQLLWTKPLPSGVNFILSDEIPRKLYHKSELGDFLLSSDSIGHTYKSTKAMSQITKKIPSHEMDHFFSVCSSIGAYMVFPANKIDNRMTINMSRGLNRSIKDRFDLTLECIRLFYTNMQSPLTETFKRYSSFFNLFQSFKGYANFFLLQDLIDPVSFKINFWLPFENFDKSPLPKNVNEYLKYKRNAINFIKKRNIRIAKCNK